MDAAVTIDTTLAIAADYDNRPDALIEILHHVQAAVGYVPEEVVQALADTLNLSRAEVHGVVTFYHDFKREPHGRHVLKMCRAESCQSMGSEALVKVAEANLGISCGGTTADHSVTLEPAYCLGLCAMSPAAMMDGRPIGRLNEARLHTLLREARS